MQPTLNGLPHTAAARHPRTKRGAAQSPQPRVTQARHSTAPSVVCTAHLPSCTPHLSATLGQPDNLLYRHSRSTACMDVAAACASRRAMVPYLTCPTLPCGARRLQRRLSPPPPLPRSAGAARQHVAQHAQRPEHEAQHDGVPGRHALAEAAQEHRPARRAARC